MSKQPTTTWPYLLLRDRKKSVVPLYLQLHHALRNTILYGQLGSGTQLPPTRVLATELAVSRTTVVTAFDQLLAEGYLETRAGSGTFVASTLPEDLLHVQIPQYPVQYNEQHPRLSQASQRMVHSPLVSRRKGSFAKAFQPGLPALYKFPFALWSRLAAEQGLEVQALSSCNERPLQRSDLLLGYAGTNEHEIRAGVKQLIKVLANIV